MLKKNGITLIIFLFSVLFLNGSFRVVPECKKQGIKGTVFLVKGNQMPSPDIPPPVPKPFKTTVYIYALTDISQVVKQDESSFYTDIRTKLIKVVQSNSKGGFKVRLDPGQYSVFTKKGELFYANTFDQYNHIAPVTVEPGNFAEITIRVDDEAVY